MVTFAKVTPAKVRSEKSQFTRKSNYGVNMYQREKRRFAKLIIEQYKKLNNTEIPTKYGQDHRRLREYAEALFIAIMQKRVTLLKPSDIKMALGTQLASMPPEHAPQMRYVSYLAIGALTGESPLPFYGEYTCGNCGGLVRPSDGGFQCNNCLSRSRADQNGFPVSLPAKVAVREGRRSFHNNIRKISDLGVTCEEAYILIAFELKAPLPTVHAGFCVTESEIDKLVKASKMVIQKLERVIKE